MTGTTYFAVMATTVAAAGIFSYYFTRKIAREQYSKVASCIPASEMLAAENEIAAYLNGYDLPVGTSIEAIADKLNVDVSKPLTNSQRLKLARQCAKHIHNSAKGK